MTLLMNMGAILGGLGLFLLAMKLITDGLRLAAGKNLRKILGHWTNTPRRGIFSGFLITAIVQSSSAVTVATIGFVNAGLLTLHQALGVVYGTNVGTTMTAWLVALLGFKLKIEYLALPLIGLGMLLRLFAANSRRMALGDAIAGFGLFFIGINILVNAFDGAANSLDIHGIAADNVATLILFLLIGAAVTVLTQSSSAATAMILTAVTGNLLSLSSAAAMVIGANIGTTSTAALAVINATPNARRVATAHILFNVLTAIVALLLLPVLLWFVEISSELLGLHRVPAIMLALFHTTFNIIGVALMWPLTSRLVAILMRHFQTPEEIESRPRYLDKSVLASPLIALNALTRELAHLSDITHRMCLHAIEPRVNTKTEQLIRTDRTSVEKLNNEIARFVTRLGQSTLPAEVSEHLPEILRTAGYLTTCAGLATTIHAMHEEIGTPLPPALQEHLEKFRSQVSDLLNKAAVDPVTLDSKAIGEQLQATSLAYQELKNDLLNAGASHQLDIPQMHVLLTQHSQTRRLLEQYVKASRYLNKLSTLDISPIPAGTNSMNADAASG